MELQLSDADAATCQRAIQEIYRELANEVAGVRPPVGLDAGGFLHEQEELSVQYERSLQVQIDAGEFREPFRHFAHGF